MSLRGAIERSADLARHRLHVGQIERSVAAAGRAHADQRDLCALQALGRIIGGFTFETVGTATRLSRWSEIPPGGFRGALGALIGPLVKRTQRTEMANIKRLVEARA